MKGLAIAFCALLVLSAGPAVAQQSGSRYEAPPPEPAEWPAPTHYISPQGSDSSAGTAPDAAWQTFGYALAQLRPGDVLGVMDGTYTPETTGLVFADCGNGGTTFNGRRDAPVTVRAVNERQPLLKSDGLIPAVWITRCRNWNVLGLTAVGADQATEENAFYNETTKGMEPVYVLVGVHRSRNVTLKRMLAVHSNRLGKNGNNHVYAVENSSDVIIEESEAYEHHRHAMIGWRSEHVTYRRNYVNPRDHWRRAPTGGGTPLQLAEPGSERARQSAAEGLAFYRTSWGLMENNISEGKNAGFQSHGGDTYTLNPGGSWNHFLGNIALRPDHSRFDARRHPYPQAKPALGLLIKDHVVARAQGRGVGIWLSSVTDALIESVTIVGGEGFGFRAHPRGDSPSCEMLVAYGGCSFTLRNALVGENAGRGIWSVGQDAWRVAYANAYDNGEGNYVPSEEAIGDAEGHIRQSMSEEPTGMGLEQGECIVFVPESSNMSGAGENGADIGANVLYRYEGGALTDKPLWEAETGAFPQGAVIDSLNGVAGRSLRRVHERLNVNTKGCRLPYAERRQTGQ